MTFRDIAIDGYRYLVFSMTLKFCGIEVTICEPGKSMKIIGVDLQHIAHVLSILTGVTITPDDELRLIMDEIKDDTITVTVGQQYKLSYCGNIQYYPNAQQCIGAIKALRWSNVD